MKYEVVFTDIADMEVQNIVLWHIGYDPDGVSRWQGRFEQAVRSLSQFPRRCPAAPEQKRFEKEVRQLIHGRYRILFTIIDANGDGNEDTVSILHVRHGAQHWPTEEDNG